VRFILLFIIPLTLFSQELEFDIFDIENAPIALPVDFFPDEDPFEGIVKPALIKQEPEFAELIKIHELNTEYRKKELMGDADFSAVEELTPPPKKYKELAEQEKESPKGEPQDFHIYLKKGTRVKDLKYHYTKTVYRDILVKAVREYPSAPFFKILDRKGKPRFEVGASDVNYVGDTIDLNPKPKKFEIQTKGPQNRAYDIKAKFQHVLGLNLESWDASYFYSLTKNQNTSDANAFKIDYKLYHLWDFPVNFGLLISYENGSWDPWAWNSFYFGMGLKIPWNIASWITLEGHITWQTSLFFSFKGDGSSYNLTNNYVGLALELIFKTGAGDYFVGVQYKKIYWSAKNQPIELPAEKSSSSAIGVNLGLKFNSIINL